MGLTEELAETIWLVRGLLVSCLYKLEVENLMLRTGRTQKLELACAEVEAALTEIRRAALVLSVSSDTVASELGLPAGSSLAELARASRDPWPAILLSHRVSLLGLVQRLGNVQADTGDLTAALDDDDLAVRILGRKVLTPSLREFVR